MHTDDELRRALAAWELGEFTVEAFGRGMGSQTWLVRTTSDRFVAKAVGGQAAFERGLEAALVVDAAGIPAGAPQQTSRGELTVPIGDARLALLAFVEGRPVDRDIPVEARAWGRTLASIHRVLLGHDQLADGLDRLPLIDVDAPFLDIEPWIRPAIEPVLDEVMQLGGTTGFLHGDPAREAFLIDGDMMGVIDWASVWWGPLLYDVASARMYAGADAFSHLLDGYLESSPIDPAEMDALELFWRFRWCVQAYYFAWRISISDMTGIDDPAENHKGLDDARVNLGVGDL